MGGRGASSGKGSNGGLSKAISKLNAKLDPDSEMPVGYEKEATKVLNGFNKVLDDFNIKNGVNKIYFGEDTSGNANMDGLGNLSINNSYLKNPATSTKGWFTSDTLEGTGAHEAGHRVVNILLRKNMSGKKELEIANARSNGKLEKQVIKEATKRYGGNPSISQYGDKNVKEKVAEAFSDVYANGNKANDYSKTIVNVMKDINNGKFEVKL